MTSSTTDVALEERLRTLSVDAPSALVARVLATAAVVPGADLSGVSPCAAGSPWLPWRW